MIKNKFNSVIYTAIILIVFAIIYSLDGLRVAPPLTKNGAIGVTFLPLINASILIIFSVLLLMNALKEEKMDYNFQLSRIGNPFKIIGLTVIFSLVMEKIGFFISTTVYVFFIMLIFEQKKNSKIKSFVYSLVVTLFIYLLFEKAFNVRLPKLFVRGI